MTVPQSKAALLAAIDTNYRKLREVLDQVPPDRILEASLEGHVAGTWMSAHDLVAYLVGWNELVLKWCAGRDAGAHVDFPEEGFRWNELGQLAQKFYRDYEAVPFPELLQRLDAAKARIVGLIQRLDDGVLYGVPWYDKWTLGRMIQLNTSSPYDNARRRLRAWSRNNAASEPSC